MTDIPLPLFSGVTLDADAVCPKESCTFNLPDLHFPRNGFTGSVRGTGF